MYMKRLTTQERENLIIESFAKNFNDIKRKEDKVVVLPTLNESEGDENIPTLIKTGSIRQHEKYTNNLKPMRYNSGNGLLVWTDDQSRFHTVGIYGGYHGGDEPNLKHRPKDADLEDALNYLRSHGYTQGELPLF